MALGCALSHGYRMLSGNLGAGSLVFNLVGNLSCEEKSLEAKSIIFGYSLVHFSPVVPDSCWTEVGAWILMIAVNNIAWRPNPFGPFGLS